MEAISHAGMAIGIQTSEGIVLAAEKKVTSKLLENVSKEKIYNLNEYFYLRSNICCAVAGITSDANNLINYARLDAQKYLYRYNQSIPVEQLVQNLCNLKQGYTQYGGLRPFGVSFLFAGWDKNHGFQLYHSDPSGNYSGWQATCVGNNSTNGSSMLKSDFKEDLKLSEAISLAIKVLSKTMDVEFAVISRKDGTVVFDVYTNEAIDGLLSREGVVGPVAAK